MSRALKSYRTFEQCPKCGHEDPMIKWFGHFLTACDHAYAGEEHFHVTCPRCGYWWAEQVKVH